MTKVFRLFPIIVVVFCFAFGPGEALECYNCYTGETYYRSEAMEKGAEFLPCNLQNLTESNAWTCSHPNSKCVYRKLQFESTKNKLIWRTCSSGISDPCDTKKLLPGVKLLECRFCSTDRCNLLPNEVDSAGNSTNTFNINANINLYVRRV